METTLRKLPTLSAFNPANLNPKPNKIELQSCRLKEIKCKEHLSMINNFYFESETYLQDKDYYRSIEKLKSAFYKTTELKDSSCMKCSQLFRSTIINSLKGIQEELEKRTTGFFGNKRHQASFIMVGNVLQELEKFSVSGSVQPKNFNEHYIGPYLKKSVS